MQRHPTKYGTKWRDIYLIYIWKLNLNLIRNHNLLHRILIAILNPSLIFFFNKQQVRMGKGLKVVKTYHNYNVRQIVKAKYLQKYTRQQIIRIGQQSCKLVTLEAYKFTSHELQYTVTTSELVMDRQFCTMNVMKVFYCFILLSMASFCDASSKKILIKKKSSHRNKSPVKSIKVVPPFVDGT